MLTAYEPIGLPIEFLLLSCGGGVGMLGWVVYWLSRGFRARVPVTRLGRCVLWGVVGVMAVVAAFFPPVRKAGNWQDDLTGERLPPAAADELDRFYFGRMPRLVWAGTVGSEEVMPTGVRVDLGQTRGRCERARRVIDWTAVAVEAGCLALLALPFARAKRPVRPPVTT